MGHRVKDGDKGCVNVYVKKKKKKKNKTLSLPLAQKVFN